MKNKKWIWILIYLAAVAACIFVIYIIPSVAGLLEGTYVAEYGDIEVSDDAKAYVLRNEKVYTASKACNILQKAKEGQLVRVGTPIVAVAEGGTEEISGRYSTIVESLGKAAVATESGSSKHAGYVAYMVDGAEPKLSYDKLTELKRSSIESYTGAKVIKTASGDCAKGEPVFKIVANGDWWLVYYVDNKTAEKYSEDKVVKLTIGDETVSASVDSIKKGKENSRIVLCCSVFVKDYLTMREADIKVTTSSGEGLIINDKSIVKKDGHKGVLVKNKYGHNVFYRISVLADDGEKSAVEQDRFLDEKGNYVETIGIYYEIVSSPSKSEVEKAE